MDENVDQKPQTLIPLDKLTDPELKKVFERIGATIEADAQKVGAEIRTELSERKTALQMWLPMCPMPTDLCRVSPFFPLNRNELDERSYIKEMVITQTSWGEILYSGPVLSVYDEDVLVAVLAILDHLESRETIEHEGRTTYQYTGPVLPILKMMGHKTPGKKDYEHLFGSLRLMATAAVRLIIGNKKGTKEKAWTMSNIVSRISVDEKTKVLTVVINPYFYEIYAKGNVTRIDVERRMRLKSAIAKALYRFVMSHRDPEWSGHMLTLAAALNLATNRPLPQVRRLIKKAIKDLRKENILTRKSNLFPGDIVKLFRTEEATARMPIGSGYGTQLPR